MPGFSPIGARPVSSLNNAVSAVVAYSLSGAAGSYSITGNAGTFVVGRKLTGDAGSYAITGNDGTLTYTPFGGVVNYTLSGAAGSYVVNGNAGTFTYRGLVDLSAFSGGWLRQVGKKRKPKDAEELAQIDLLVEAAVEHKLESAKKNTKIPKILSLSDIIGAKAFEQLGKADLQHRLNLEAKIQQIQAKKRRMIDDEEFIMFG